MADQSILLEVILENGQMKMAAKDTANHINLIGDAAKKTGDGGASGMNQLGSMAGNIASKFKAAAIVTIIAGIGKAIYEMSKEALAASAAMEKNRVTLEVLLGSQSKANKLLDNIKKMAVQTPFEVSGIVDVTKQLLAFGIAENDVIATMTNLGNASMGNQETFSRLGDAYGKVAAKGKLSFEELNRFLEAGVPILDVLAKQYNVTTGQMAKMIENGQVGFSALNKAMTSLTTGNGQFAGMMEKQSQTLNGQLSNLKDTWGQLSTEMGDKMAGGAKDTLKALQGIIAEGSTLRTVFVGIGSAIGVVLDKVAEKIVDLDVLLARMKQDFYMTMPGYGIGSRELSDATEGLDQAEARRTQFRRDTGREILRSTSNNGEHSLEETYSEASDAERAEFLRNRNNTPDTGRAPRTGPLDSIGGGQALKSSGSVFADLDPIGGLEAKLEERLTLINQYRTKNLISADHAATLEEELWLQHYENVEKTIEDQAKKQEDRDKKDLTKIQSKVKSVMDVINTGLSFAQNMMGQLTQIFSIQDKIAEDKMAKQKALGESVLEWQHQQALVTAGLVEESKIKQYDKEIALLETKLSREKNAKERAKLQEELNEKKSLRNKEKIEQDYLRNKESYEAIMEFKRRKMAYEAFKRNQAMSVATTIIQSQVAGISAFAGMQSSIPGIPGIIAGAVAVAGINTMAGAMIGYILSQNPPLAAGGYIPGSEYGRTYQIAEKGRGEVVLPVDDPATVAKLQNVMGGSDRPIIINLDGRMIAEVITPHQNQMASARSARNFSYQSAY